MKTDSLEKITNLVVKSLRELGDEKKNKNLSKASEDTKIYGIGGHLDSLSLVLLISNIEEKVSKFFGREITLADERAMSQKTSPFLSVTTLSDYIFKILHTAPDE